MLPAATAESGQTNPLTQGKALPGAYTALALLLAINLFNYIDRNVLAAVEPEIRKELFPKSEGPEATKEEKTKAQILMGLLSTAFILSFMCTAPLFAKLAEKWSHWWIVGVGVTLWSVASAASGMDWGAHFLLAFALLLTTRLLVGVGEGAYGPVAPTMLSDLFPVNKRGQVMTWFYLAIPVGAALGYALGAWVLTNSAFGGSPDSRWRWAFYLVLPPGLLLGTLCFFMRDPPRGQSDSLTISAERRGSWHDYVYLMKIPSFWLNTVGMTAMNFGIGGLAYWMAAYLEERKKKETVDLIFSDTFTLDARTMFGIVTATAGLVATLLGGLAGDYLRRRIKGAYFLVSGIVMIIGFPMILLFLATPFPWAWVFGFFAVFCLFFSTGPTNAILANVTHPSLRATGFALNIFIIHAFGDAISPTVLGGIAGITGTETESNFHFAFVVVSVTMVFGGALWIWGTKYLDRDTELAHTRLPELDPHLTGPKVTS